VYFSVNRSSTSALAANMMLGRKQSLKGEPVLADYGPEEALNESADIEWVNMVIIFFMLVDKCMYEEILL
jgi:hypothetical protein